MMTFKHHLLWLLDVCRFRERQSQSNWTGSQCLSQLKRKGLRSHRILVGYTNKNTL